MDRASDSGSEGWGFESLPVYQKSRYPSGYLLFWFSGKKGTRKGGTSACTGAKTVRWTVFSPWESPSYSRCIRQGCRWNMNFCLHCSGRDSKNEIQLSYGLLVTAVQPAATPLSPMDAETQVRLLRCNT